MVHYRAKITPKRRSRHWDKRLALLRKRSLRKSSTSFQLKKTKVTNSALLARICGPFYYLLQKTGICLYPVSMVNTSPFNSMSRAMPFTRPGRTPRILLNRESHTSLHPFSFFAKGIVTEWPGQGCPLARCALAHRARPGGAAVRFARPWSCSVQMPYQGFHFTFLFQGSPRLVPFYVLAVAQTSPLPAASHK